MRTLTTSLGAVGKDMLDSSKHEMLREPSMIFWRVKLSFSFQMQKYHLGLFCLDKNDYYVWMQKQHHMVFAAQLSRSCLH